MLSYKQWKTLNESILPSFSLGIGNPSNLGLQSPFSTLEEGKKKSKKKMWDDEDDAEDVEKDDEEKEDEEEGDGEDAETGDGEVVEPSSEKDDPDVDVEVGEDEEESPKGCGAKCGAKCAKCGRMSKKKSKKKCGADMNPLEGDDDEEDDNDFKSKMKSKGRDEEEDDEEEDEDEGDEGKEEKEMPMMMSKKKSKMKSKKKMASGEEDGCEEDKDDKDVKMVDDKMDSKKKSKKKMKESTEEDAWWNSVRNMIGPAPDTKYNDGWTDYFKQVDTDNLTQSIRNENFVSQISFRVNDPKAFQDLCSMDGAECESDDDAMSAGIITVLQTPTSQPLVDALNRMQKMGKAKPIANFATRNMTGKAVAMKDYSSMKPQQPQAPKY